MRLLPCVALLSALALNASHAGDVTNSDQNRTAHDAQFITQVYALGETEIAAAKLAQQMGNTSAAKSMAEIMLADHSQWNQQLQTIAHKDGFDAAIARAQPNSMAKLKTLHGDTFDQGYASMMVGNHRDLIALFQVEVNSTNPDLRRFATDTLPSLEHHLVLATALMKAEGGF